MSLSFARPRRSRDSARRVREALIAIGFVALTAVGLGTVAAVAFAGGGFLALLVHP